MKSSRDGRRIASAWALSVAGHAAIVGAGALLVARSLSQPPADPAAAPPPRPSDAPIEIELPEMTAGGVGGVPATDELQAPLPRGGGEATPRPDTGARGRGGADESDLPALNLADRDERLLLSREVRSRLDRSQIQRIRSGARRATREDWRASREPTELTFLASGRTGARPERRTPADHDPSLGALDRGAPERRGDAFGAAPLPPGAVAAVQDPAGVLPPAGAPAAPAGTPDPGGARDTAGLGVRDGRPGADHRESAAVPHARPLVAEGTPSVPANAEGKPGDTVDSEQEVATALQSIVHASTAGGARGTGPGGQAGAGPTGAGGVTGPGSTAKALGTGAGGPLDNDALDRRRSLYVRQIMAKVHPLWASAFPKWAAAEGLQGTVIVTFVLRADGTVASASITRPSGIAEFDENCRRAVLRGAPYAPLPPELGTTFRWSMPFEAKNPAVLPKRPAESR